MQTPPPEAPAAPIPPPFVAAQETAPEQIAAEADTDVLPAKEPQFSEAGERQAYNTFNIARQRNAAADPSAAGRHPSEPYGHSD